MSETVVSPVAGQPFVVTGSNHGHQGHHQHENSHLDAATLRETIAGQRELNATFRAADAERSRNAIAAADNARDSERNHARTREAQSDRMAVLEKTLAELRDQVKAEANATREVLRLQEITRLSERAALAEAKIAALYAANHVPSTPSM